ncbi:hypothetical protein BTO15_13550 [Polaribacter sejongensis]|uniref:DUF3108 domain-containing protein n=1 Tax=Polaribacter sejongensis TaxID=985043 RepID=A0ABM6Q1J3_9FLAO|nr:DUF6503 family protein [Polaribacter sejongensis]AUC23055.1 hypothetical protein BTO15_13550 [Polaribacter sejongensis]
MHATKIILIAFSFLFFSCGNKKTNSEVKTETNTEKETPITFKNKGHKLVYNTVQKTGNYQILAAKKDVVYTYSYQTPDGKTDISTEKYIFDGELSYGAYTKHERTLTDLKGKVEQGYDGNEYWLKNNGEIITDSAALKKVAFNRPTNFYWFCMIQKLLDPSVQYQYINEQTIEGTVYDVVKITFDGSNNKPKDIYQVYINKETKMIDQFLFTVMDFEKSDPLLMQLKYENIEGILIPTQRKYKASNWDAEVTDAPWIQVNWTNIKFNNGLQKEMFKK